MSKTWVHTHLPRLRSGDTLDVLSVKIPGQRIDYASLIVLRDAEFRVHEKGRQRCLEYGVRNVHAWVVGGEVFRRVDYQLPDRTPTGWRKAVYDPWKGSAFVDAETLTAVFEAEFVILSGKNVWYIP